MSRELLHARPSRMCTMLVDLGVAGPNFCFRLEYLTRRFMQAPGSRPPVATRKQTTRSKHQADSISGKELAAKPRLPHGCVQNACECVIELRLGESPPPRFRRSCVLSYSLNDTCCPPPSSSSGSALGSCLLIWQQTQAFRPSPSCGVRLMERCVFASDLPVPALLLAHRSSCL